MDQQARDGGEGQDNTEGTNCWAEKICCDKATWADVKDEVHRGAGKANQRVLCPAHRLEEIPNFLRMSGFPRGLHNGPDPEGHL